MTTATKAPQANRLSARQRYQLMHYIETNRNILPKRTQRSILAEIKKTLNFSIAPTTLQYYLKEFKVPRLTRRKAKPVNGTALSQKCKQSHTSARQIRVLTHYLCELMADLDTPIPGSLEKILSATKEQMK